MSVKNVTFRISRYKPGDIDPPRLREYILAVNGEMTVLDGLEAIRREQDKTLMYRHSCHHSSCGTCAMVINGEEKLACLTRVISLESDSVTLEPLKGFKRLGDLVVEMAPLFRHIAEDWPHLRPVEVHEGAGADTDGTPPTRFENCIECGCCVSACPVFKENQRFMGPAALSALHREIEKSSHVGDALIRRARRKEGAPMCVRALACSRVCPTAVYPARHIAELKKFDRETF